MSVEQDKNTVMWNGRGRVQEVNWDESNSQTKGYSHVLFCFFCFFVLTQVRESKNIRLYRAFYLAQVYPVQVTQKCVKYRQELGHLYKPTLQNKMQIKCKVAWRAAKCWTHLNYHKYPVQCTVLRLVLRRCGFQLYHSV